MKNEGALSKRFFRHTGIYRSDVSSLLLNLGQSTAFRSGPGQALGRAGRTRPAHRRDEFRPAIPQRVARQQCPSPLHRHPQLKTIAAANGIFYHRTVSFLLTVCLTIGDNLTLVPLSRFPKGESRGGRVPPTPQKRRLPPQEGKPPCAIPQKKMARVKIFVDRGRPSHGSRDREGADDARACHRFFDSATARLFFASS